MKIESFLESDPYFTLVQTKRRIEKQTEKALEPYSLSLLQAYVLVALFVEDSKSALFSDLLKAFCAQKSSFSHLISELESRKLVTRKNDAYDRRRYWICLSKKGMAYAPNIVNILHANLADVESKLGVHELRKWIEVSKGI